MVSCVLGDFLLDMCWYFYYTICSTAVRLGGSAFIICFILILLCPTFAERKHPPLPPNHLHNVNSNEKCVIFFIHVIFFKCLFSHRNSYRNYIYFLWSDSNIKQKGKLFYFYFYFRKLFSSHNIFLFWGTNICHKLIDSLFKLEGFSLPNSLVHVWVWILYS